MKYLLSYTKLNKINSRRIILLNFYALSGREIYSGVKMFHHLSLYFIQYFASVLLVVVTGSLNICYGSFNSALHSDNKCKSYRNS